MIAPMGGLAQAVLDQFGERADAAVQRLIIERCRSGEGAPGRLTRLDDCGEARVYGARELAQEPIRPGNWVTIAEVTIGSELLLIDVNVGTGEFREIPGRRPRRGPESMPVSPAN